jgi:hypothetical protein
VRRGRATSWTAILLAACAASAALLAAPARAPASSARTCGAGYVLANLSWGEKCLRAGEFCKTGDVEYRRYGFDCPAGRLVASGRASTASAVVPPLGRTVLLHQQTRTSGCRRGPLPDRRCSPGAYYSGLTRKVICSRGFRTAEIRDVPQSEKYGIEEEYEMPPRLYGRRMEIDHIVPLELGGSNAPVNLFPEPGGGIAGYHVKDELENRLHDLVCGGRMTLGAAQRGIASNWEALYRRVFGVAP